MKHARTDRRLGAIERQAPRARGALRLDDPELVLVRLESAAILAQDGPDSQRKVRAYWRDDGNATLPRAEMTAGELAEIAAAVGGMDVLARCGADEIDEIDPALELAALLVAARQDLRARGITPAMDRCPKAPTNDDGRR